MDNEENRKLYEVLSVSPELRKMLFELYRKGDYEQANFVIRTMNYRTTIQDFWIYLSMQ